MRQGCILTKYDAITGAFEDETSVCIKRALQVWNKVISRQHVPI
jgi:hypothetical protein